MSSVVKTCAAAAYSTIKMHTIANILIQKHTIANLIQIKPFTAANITNEPCITSTSPQ